MASGHMSRTYRPNPWLPPPAARREILIRRRPRIALKKYAVTPTDTQRIGRVLPMPILDGLQYVRVWIFDRDNDDHE